MGREHLSGLGSILAVPVLLTGLASCGGCLTQSKAMSDKILEELLRADNSKIIELEEPGHKEWAYNHPKLGDIVVSVNEENVSGEKRTFIDFGFFENGKEKGISYTLEDGRAYKAEYTRVGNTWLKTEEEECNPETFNKYFKLVSKIKEKH